MIKINTADWQKKNFQKRFVFEVLWNDKRNPIKGIFLPVEDEFQAKLNLL